MNKPDWATDERFTTNAQRVKHRVVLEAAIEEVTRTKTTEEWLDIFEGSGLPYAAVNDVLGTLNHEHSMHPQNSKEQHLISIPVQARNMIETVSHPALGDIKLVNTPVKYSETQPSIRSPPPLLGQHSDQVLKELLGMKQEDITRLRNDGVVA